MAYNMLNEDNQSQELLMDDFTDEPVDKSKQQGSFNDLYANYSDKNSNPPSYSHKHDLSNGTDSEGKLLQNQDLSKSEAKDLKQKINNEGGNHEQKSDPDSHKTASFSNQDLSGQSPGFHQNSVNDKQINNLVGNPDSHSSSVSNPEKSLRGSQTTCGSDLKANSTQSDISNTNLNQADQSKANDNAQKIEDKKSTKKIPAKVRKALNQSQESNDQPIFECLAPEPENGEQKKNNQQQNGREKKNMLDFVFQWYQYKYGDKLDIRNLPYEQQALVMGQFLEDYGMLEGYQKKPQQPTYQNYNYTMGSGYKELKNYGQKINKIHHEINCGLQDFSLQEPEFARASSNYSMYQHNPHQKYQQQKRQQQQEEEEDLYEEDEEYKQQNWSVHAGLRDINTKPRGSGQKIKNQYRNQPGQLSSIAEENVSESLGFESVNGLQSVGQVSTNENAGNLGNSEQSFGMNSIMNKFDVNEMQLNPNQEKQKRQAAERAEKEARIENERLLRQQREEQKRKEEEERQRLELERQLQHQKAIEDEAEDAFQKSIAQNPEQSQNSLEKVLGEIDERFRAMETPDQRAVIMKIYEKTFAYFTGWEDQQQIEIEPLAKAYFQAGRMAKASLNIELAFKYFTKTVQIYNKSEIKYQGAEPYFELAKLYAEIQNNDEAMTLLKKSRELYRASQNKFEEYSLLHCVAQIEIRQKKYDEALKTLKEADDKRLSMAQSDYPDTDLEVGELKFLKEQARIYYEQRDLAKMKPLLTKGLEIIEKAKKEFNAEGYQGVKKKSKYLSEEASFYNLKSSVYLMEGQIEKARSYINKAIVNKIQNYGTESTEAATMYSDRANLEICAKRGQKALEYFQKAYNIYKKLYKKNINQTILAVMRGMAEAQRIRGDTKAATLEYEQILLNCTQAFGNNSKMTADAQIDVADIYLYYENDKDKANEALKLFLKALKTKQALADDRYHESLISVLHKISIQYFKRKEYDQAVMYIQQCFEAVKKNRELAQVREQESKIEEWLNKCNDALEKDPKNRVKPIQKANIQEVDKIREENQENSVNGYAEVHHFSEFQE